MKISIMMMGALLLSAGAAGAAAPAKAASAVKGRGRGVAQVAGDGANDAEKRGFNTPGTNTGGNPFSPRPPAPVAEEDEEEDFGDEEEEGAASPSDAGLDQLSEEILRSRMENRLKERAQGGLPQGGSGSALSGMGSSSRGSARGRGGIDFRNASGDVGATSLAGGANSKIESGQKAGCLKLDPNTGYGPDIVSNFDFPDADIVEIAKTLGRLTCINFIYDKDVKGRISIVSNAPITIGEAWKAFLTSLEMNNFSVVPSGAYLRITRKREAREKQIKTYAGDFSPDTDTLITRVLPLKYIGAEEAARVFRNFMSPDTRIVNYDQTNTLIITDTGANVKKLVDIIKLLDVEGYDEGLEVIRIKNASAQEIAKLIDQLLPGNRSGVAPGAPAGIPRFGGGGFTARKTKEGGVISHIIPDDRTNSVIVSANKQGLTQVRKLIEKLDSRVTASAGSSRIHVVYLQFADCKQVAQTLSNLASGSNSASKAPPQLGAAPVTASLFEEAIKVSADEPTNSIVVTGSPTDFQTMSRVIAKLDVPRDQVYVETIVMEINLDKHFDLGTAVALPNSGISFVPEQSFGAAFGNLLTNPLANTGLVMGFQGGSSSKSFTVPGTANPITVKSLQGLILALEQNTVGNVLATPQILTLDNQEAEIEIGETIPVPTVTAVQGAGSQQSFTREKVTLALKIKPQINKISNFVKLDIKQKYEDFSSRTVQGPVPGTVTRSSSTTVVVQDSDTVAMGGLMRDKTDEKTTKVPLLGDIPLVGWLFRSKSTQSTKTNLLVFITPHIVKQYQAVRKVLDKALQRRDEFLEKNAGGEDPLLDAKLNLIKDLPPLESLKNNAPVISGDIQTASDALREDREDGAAPREDSGMPLQRDDKELRPGPKTEEARPPGFDSMAPATLPPPTSGVKKKR